MPRSPVEAKFKPYMEGKSYPPGEIYKRYPFLAPLTLETAECRQRGEPGPLPNHIAIIMDGNRRWIRSQEGQDAEAIKGHVAGMRNIIGILRDLRALPIKYVTLWGFSPENWKRKDEEVNGLMNLFIHAIPEQLEEIKASNGRFVHLGRKDRIPEELRRVIENAEAETASNAGQVVCLGLDWGGQDQELRVMERFAREFPAGTTPTPEILRQLSDTHLADGTDIPEIDLVYRTGAEQRTSGIPNADYAEFYPIFVPLPSATTTDFVYGLVSYAGRQRRFGGDCAPAK